MHRAATVNLVLASAKKVAIGDVRTMGERRQKMLEEFGKMSVSAEQILAYVEKPDMESITGDDMELLLGTYTAIKEGIANVDEVFVKKGAKEAGKEVPIVQLNVMYSAIKSKLSADHIIAMDEELKSKGVDLVHPKNMIPSQINDGITIVQNWAKRAL